MGNRLINGFIGNFLLFPLVKNENRLRFDEVIALSLVAVSYTHLTLPTIYSV